MFRPSFTGSPLNCSSDLFHNQDLRQGQSGAGTEAGRFREAAHYVGRRSERGRQVRGQILARQGP